MVTPEITFSLGRPQVQEDGSVKIPEGEWDGVPS